MNNVKEGEQIKVKEMFKRLITVAELLSKSAEASIHLDYSSMPVHENTESAN